MRNLYFLTLLFLISVPINAQVTEKLPIQITDIDIKISEVYQSEISNLDAERIAFIKNLLNNRIAFYKEKNTPQDKYTKLSQISLYNKYNPQLERDLNFDPNTFNPLKYNFNFYSQYDQVYRVDNTDYIIVIESQKRK
jgi:hypothetical protein